MNEDTYTPCTKCGRPMAYCKGKCCGKKCGCNCKEYGPAICGAIRPRQPECPYTAVVPSITVDHASNLRDLCDTFVHVSDINTTYYIDDKHRTIITWAGPVEYDNYDLVLNPLGLRSQFLIDFANNRGAYYNKVGNYQVFNFGDGTDDELLSFTMHYPESESGVPLPGWSADNMYGVAQNYVPIAKYPDADRIVVKMNAWCDPQPNDKTLVSFTNDKTGEEITAQDLYGMLLDGADIVLNHVPLGFRFATEEEYGDAYTYVDGVKLTRCVVPPHPGWSESVLADPYEEVAFSGSSFVRSSAVANGEIITPDAVLSFTISGSKEVGSSDLPDFERVTVQGFGIIGLS